MSILQRLCERITHHKWRKGYAYSVGISPIEYHYRCRICEKGFWNYRQYKGAPAQDTGYDLDELDRKMKGEI